MAKMYRLIFCLLLGLLQLRIHAGDRPNILWITSEDNSYHYVGAYGNDLAKTPNLDRLAERGLLFEHAYSNAPVCAVARSTILTGTYAITQGTNHMRSRYPIPEHIKPYVYYLREAGYYCTNNHKTDFNMIMKGVPNDQAIWDESSREAHYKNREEGQPFFAIFNFTSTHESNLFPHVIARNRESGNIPQTPRVDPADVEVPTYLTDEPIYREDIAIYHDNMTYMDSQVGQVLKELEEAGLAEDTIIFYYSDHGGTMPRTKRWIYDSGTHIPMLAYVPEKWRHLSPYKMGSRISEPVAFVDLAPTLMAIAGIDIPDHMQGEPIIGSKDLERQKEYVYLFADRFDESYKFRRGVTDGEYRYIKNFFPHRRATLPIYYPYGIRSWQRFRELALAGELKEPWLNYYLPTFAGEHLYHTDSDKWEIHNLAGDSDYQDKLKKLRKETLHYMKKTYDVGFVPEAMYHEFDGMLLYDVVRQQDFDYARVIDFAFAVTDVDFTDYSQIHQGLGDDHPLIRYWSVIAANIHDLKDPQVRLQMITKLDDPFIAVQTEACIVLDEIGAHEVAKNHLLAALNTETTDGALTTVLNALITIDAKDDIPLEWLKSKTVYEVRGYHNRLAENFLEERLAAEK